MVQPLPFETPNMRAFAPFGYRASAVLVLLQHDILQVGERCVALGPRKEPLRIKDPLAIVMLHRALPRQSIEFMFKKTTLAPGRSGK